MFKITLTPIFNPGADALTVTTVGNIITVNGIEYDFTLLDEGDTLPHGAVPPPFINAITKANGRIEVTLLFPYEGDAPHEVRFPTPIMVDGGGPVQLPTTPVEPEPPLPGIGELDKESSGDSHE